MIKCFGFTINARNARVKTTTIKNGRDFPSSIGTKKKELREYSDLLKRYLFFTTFIKVLLFYGWIKHYLKIAHTETKSSKTANLMLNDMGISGNF